MVALTFLVGLQLAVASVISTVAATARAIGWRVATGVGMIPSGLRLVAEWFGYHWSNWREERRQRREEKYGPFLDQQAMAAWLAAERDWREITGETARIRDERPAESALDDTRELPLPATWFSANGSDSAVLEPTRTLMLPVVDSPQTRILAAWQARAAMPTELVTRPCVPRSEVANRRCTDGSRSYLGEGWTPGYKPRHAALEN